MVVTVNKAWYHESPNNIDNLCLRWDCHSLLLTGSCDYAIVRKYYAIMDPIAFCCVKNVTIGNRDHRHFHGLLFVSFGITKGAIFDRPLALVIVIEG